MKTKKEEERMNLRQKEKVSIATTSLRGAALSLLGFQKSVLGIAHTHTTGKKEISKGKTGQGRRMEE